MTGRSLREPGLPNASNSSIHAGSPKMLQKMTFKVTLCNVRSRPSFIV